MFLLSVQGEKGSGKADMALSTIQKLYRIETQIKTLPIATRHHQRQDKAMPAIKTFKDWLIKYEQKVLPKIKLGESILYTLNQWNKLTAYKQDKHLNIDSNLAERCIKLFVIGRNNGLFSQTANGASESPVLYSIIETARANGLVPFTELRTLNAINIILTIKTLD